LELGGIGGTIGRESDWSRSVSYIYLGLGLWALYHAWCGIIPTSDPWEKMKGQRMRRVQRFIFAFGGALLTALGLFIIFRQNSN
jgi:hypothetical protein